MAEQPTVIVLGGCNGAGKTTASRTLLAETLDVMTFVNADVIAQGLAGFDPDSAAFEAGKIMLERLRSLASRRESFAFETTLAGRSYPSWLDSLRQSGYWVHLVYFWLRDADLAVRRVALRVKQGGHNVPEATIRLRHQRSLRNFFTLYRPVVSFWEVYDNSRRSGSVLVASGDFTGHELIADPGTWSRMKREASDE